MLLSFEEKIDLQNSAINNSPKSDLKRAMYTLLLSILGKPRSLKHAPEGHIETKIKINKLLPRYRYIF